MWARRVGVTGTLLLAALPASAQAMGGPAGHTKVYVAEEESDAVSVFEAQTAIRRGKNTVKLEDLKAGDAVTVVYAEQEWKHVARRITFRAQ